MPGNSNSIRIINVKDVFGKPISLEISTGKIIKIENEKDPSVQAAQSTEIINGFGSTIIPGLVDLHTHLREPGYEDSETVLSGSQAAIAG